jgi:two-component system response regulator FixJ
MSDKAVIYIIDDDDAARDSLDFLLKASGFDVRSYDSAIAFLAAPPNSRFGCVITDVRMPGMTGIELLKQLSSRQFILPIIVITGHGDVPLAVEAMRAGAADFLEKPYDDEALILSIKRALASAQSAAADDTTKAEVMGRMSSLSGRETEVMAGLVAGKANKAIAQELNISPRTVEIYRANVMSKMAADSLPALVRMAISAGFFEGSAKS